MELQPLVSDLTSAPGPPRLRSLFRRREAPGTTRVHPHGLIQVPQQSQGDARALGLRRNFPLLACQISGRRIIYLDSAATSQKPDAVIDAICEYYRSCNANIHRSACTLAEEATTGFEGARSRIARFVGGTPDTTIFTRNATEAINLVAYAWGRQNVREREVVLVTKMEHHSNLVPWQLLCQETGAELRYADVTAGGLLRLDDLDAEGPECSVPAEITDRSCLASTHGPVAHVVLRCSGSHDSRMPSDLLPSCLPLPAPHWQRFHIGPMEARAGPAGALVSYLLCPPSEAGQRRVRAA
jgi:Aminotransferase class-V